MSLKSPIGILGGTFDPIHQAHVMMSKFVLNKCHLSHIYFVTCYEPAHSKKPKASALDRLKMVQLALHDYEKLKTDDREIQRGSVSYMYDTLRSFQKEFSNTPLCLIMGQDSFATLPSWKNWSSLIDLAHIIIVNRPLAKPLTYDPELKEFLNQHQTDNIQKLHQNKSRYILQLNMPPLDVSATHMRKQLQKDIGFQTDELDSNVLIYIKEKGLYK